MQTYKITRNNGTVFFFESKAELSFLGVLSRIKECGYAAYDYENIESVE